jgi:hypothetical protein
LVIRCEGGGWGLPFFLLCFFYALLQFPVYLYLNLANEFQLLSKDHERFRQTVEALGILKIPLAYGFLAFLVSPTRPEFKDSAYLPQKAFAPHKGVLVPISILFVGIGGDAAAKVILAILPGFAK